MDELSFKKLAGIPVSSIGVAHHNQFASTIVVATDEPMTAKMQPRPSSSVMGSSYYNVAVGVQDEFIGHNNIAVGNEMRHYGNTIDSLEEARETYKALEYVLDMTEEMKGWMQEDLTKLSDDDLASNYKLTHSVISLLEKIAAVSNRSNVFRTMYLTQASDDISARFKETHNVAQTLNDKYHKEVQARLREIERQKAEAERLKREQRQAKLKNIMSAVKPIFIIIGVVAVIFILINLAASSGGPVTYN